MARSSSVSISVSLQPLHLQSAYVRRDVAFRTHETQRLPVTQLAYSHHIRLSVRAIEHGTIDWGTIVRSTSFE